MAHARGSMNRRGFLGEITFVPSGRGKAQCPSNPEYPDGVNIHAEKADEACCLVELPYPAPECGVFHVHCGRCDLTVVVTAAGRADDPRTLTMPCREVMN